MEPIKLESADIVRYGFLGFYAMSIFILLPVFLTKTEAFAKGIALEHVVFFAVLSFPLGYLIDSIKLYQLTPGYGKRKRAFLEEYGKKLGVSSGNSSKYFTLAKDLRTPHLTISLGRKHSEWVLVDTTSKLFVISTVVWAVISCLQSPEGWDRLQFLIPLLMVALSGLLAWRLNFVANQERTKLDNLFYEFASKNRSAILDAMSANSDLAQGTTISEESETHHNT